MDKRVANADAAIAQDRRRRDDSDRRLRTLRHPRKSDRRAAAQRHEKSHRRFEQCRRRRFRHRPAAANQASEENDRQLCGREQNFRATGAEKRNRSRIESARHACRTHSRGGAGIPAFFTPTGYGTMVAEGKEVREISTAGRTFWSRRCAAISRSSRRGRATAGEISSTARRRGISTR